MSETAIRQGIMNGLGFEDIAVQLQCSPDYIRRYWLRQTEVERQMMTRESVRRFHRDWKTKFPA